MFAFSFRFSQEQTVSYALTSEVLSGSTRRRGWLRDTGKGGQPRQGTGIEQVTAEDDWGLVSPATDIFQEMGVKNALKLSPLRRRESSVIFLPTPISH